MKRSPAAPLAATTAALTLSVLALTGCGPDARDYSVVVRNDSTVPQTVILTKDGGPMENEWLPPEDIAAMRHAPPDVRLNGIVVKPGQTVDQARHGKFDAGVNAILRVYSGDQTLETMLAISPGAAGRSDIPLAPGANAVTIDRDGKAARQ